jgi:hypothetical protein
MPIRAWFAAFVFTQLVEVPIYSTALPCSLIAAFGASAITHPIVWFGFFSPAWHAPYLAKLGLAEAFAWLVEAGYFAFRFPLRRALFWSFVANAASVSTGFASRALFGVP